MVNRFELAPGVNHGWVCINRSSVEEFHPQSSLMDLGFKQEEFVREANRLLDKYRFEVPIDFPMPDVVPDALCRQVSVSYGLFVGYCFCNFKLETQHGIDTSKLLKELIESDAKHQAG